MLRFLLAILALSTLPAAFQNPRPGYTDTPMLPGMEWRVHDPNRPIPAEITPGAGTAPPSDAIVLFDGDDLDAWVNGEHWSIVDGTMGPKQGGDLQTVQEFGDCQLHVEFRTPADEDGSGQGRGNSGIFLMGRYEIQVLDSYRNPTYPDGQAASIYGQYPPLVNPSRPAGEWQHYDIVFRAPRFDTEGALISPARVTVLHNGVLVQWDRTLLGPTSHRSLPKYSAHGLRAPLRLQNHGDAVRYRNLWIRPLDADSAEAAG